MSKICFTIVGGGWRSEFYLRLATLMPDRFEATAIACRNPARGETLRHRYGVRVVSSADDLADANAADFVVLSLPRSAAPHYIRHFHRLGTPVLCETPPAENLESLNRLWHDCREARVQVAEQYLFQPHHAARIELVRRGRIGETSSAHVSFAHGYHATAVGRALLGLGNNPTVVTAKRFTAPIVKGPTRAGLPEREIIAESTRELVSYDFGGKLLTYDFCNDQYMSYIRRRSVGVEGVRGQIIDDDVSYLIDEKTPRHTRLNRYSTGDRGDLRGYYLEGITCLDECVYVNPFAPARLSDEEIAIATCLEKMREYLANGQSFYSLADACQDAYLELLAKQAIEDGGEVRSEPQAWT